MKKTLQDQYLLIKEGKGHKGVFLTEAKRQFPNIVRNAATFEEAVSSLKTKSIISENVIGLTTVAGYEPRKKESYETAFEAFLAEAKKKENEDEKVKAEEKKVSKKVEEDLAHNFDYKDEKNPDNMIFGQIMMGYYAEMKDPKNSEKTIQELKDMVFKNLAKDPIYYTKNAQFGVKDLGYTDEAPALGMLKEAKGKYKGSGYGDLNESFMGSYGDNPHQNEPLDIEDYLEQVEGMSRDEAIEYLGRQGLSSSQALKVISQMDMDVRDMFDQDPDVKIYSADDLYERKLRKVIREMIEGELEEVTYQTSFNIANRKTPFIPKGEPQENAKYISIPDGVMKTLIERGYIIVEEDGVFVSGRFVANLDKLLTYDTASNEKAFFSNKSVYSPDQETKTNIYTGAKEPSYRKIIAPDGVEIRSSKLPEFRTNEEGDTKVVPPIDSKLLFQAIITPEAWRTFTTKPKKTMEGLMESVEKDIAQINKEAELEGLQSKKDKIQDLIDKKQSQLSKLDEDEDMKSLTDDKKVKEISKDIKALEKAKAKLEKLMGKVKGKKKEVIDEVKGEELDQQTINGITEKYNAIYEKNGVVTDSDIEKIADQYPFSEKSSIMDYLDGYEPSLEFDI